jgi:hypothetical protein
LLVLGLETSAMGKPKGVALRGGEVKLEAGAGQDAKRPGTQFERAKASA